MLMIMCGCQTQWKTPLSLLKFFSVFLAVLSPYRVPFSTQPSRCRELNNRRASWRELKKILVIAVQFEWSAAGLECASSGSMHCVVM